MRTWRVGRLARRILASAVCGSWMRPASRSGDSRRPPPAGCGGIVLEGPMGRCVGMQLGRELVRASRPLTSPGVVPKWRTSYRSVGDETPPAGYEWNGWR